MSDQAPQLDLPVSASRVGRGSQSSLDSTSPRDDAAQSTQDADGQAPRTEQDAVELNLSNSRKLRHRTKSITGETIYKDHPSHDIMLNIKLGVRHTVGRASARDGRELNLADFQYEPKTFFPARGTVETPTHRSTDFKFKDCAPLAFKHIRERFGIDAGEYMVSIGGDGALKEVPTPGKSGALFYKTTDDKFLIKTISKAESRYFRHILPQYYNHVMQYQDTLLPRFFQLFRIKTKRGNNIRMVVMHNILPSHFRITERYDLKGSTHGRRTAEEFRGRSTVTLKDLDFVEMGKKIVLGPEKKKMLMRQLDIDARFMAASKLMDYSLLVGVKPATETIREERAHHMLQSGQTTSTPTNSSHSLNTNPTAATPSPSATPRGGKFSRSELFAYDGALECHDENDNAILVYCGIIDILQEYDMRKQIEHIYKGTRFDKHTISAVAPEQYSQRFVDYLKSRVFF